MGDIGRRLTHPCRDNEKGSQGVWGQIGSHRVFLAGLKLTMQTRQALNAQRPTCLCLQGSRIKSMGHPDVCLFVFCLR